MFDSFDTHVQPEERIPSDYEEFLDELNRPLEDEEVLDEMLKEMADDIDDIPY